MSGHRWRDEWIEESAPLADGGFAAIGGLWSTVHDVARWVGFLADAFPPRDEQDDGPLCRASRREMQQVHRARRSTFDTAANRLDAGGYGYGLVVTHDLRFGHIVSHSGGLPGFGSDMRWLPDRDFGVVALANLTYAPMRAMTGDLLEHLDDHGELPPPHAIPLSEALDAACGGLERLLGDWDSNPRTASSPPTSCSTRTGRNAAPTPSDSGRGSVGGGPVPFLADDGDEWLVHAAWRTRRGDGLGDAQSRGAATNPVVRHRRPTPASGQPARSTVRRTTQIGQVSRRDARAGARASRRGRRSRRRSPPPSPG